MSENKKSFPKILLKVLIIFLSSILILLLLFLGTLNIFKHSYYNEYYDSLTKMTKTPGLNENFIPQGLTNMDGRFYTAGYMKGEEPSRIYACETETSPSFYVTLTSEGEDFFGHTGGLQYTNGSFYLANEGLGVFKFDSSLIKNAKNGDKIEIGSPIKVNNHSSFVFSDDEYLYIGEFNNDAKYQCTNTVNYNGKTQKAIVTKYEIDDLTKPLAIYSIPNEIQGFCITEDGKIVLSRSYSVSSSNFFIYEDEDIIDTGSVYDGAPLYILNESTKNIKGPSMSEDLDLVDGKVCTIFESGCNKYYFGKFFFANYIAGLAF